MSRRAARFIFTAILSGGFCVLPYSSQAKQPDAPELSSIEPFVIRVGETNQLTLKGKNLHNLKSIWTSRHGTIPVEQFYIQSSENGKSVLFQFDIELAMACGPIAIRALTDAGISHPTICFLEALPELQIADNRTLVGTGYVNGRIHDPAGVEFQVSLERDQFLPIDVMAGRFGSKLDPVLTVYGSDGNEELYVQDSPGAVLDCWYRFKAPRKETYRIRIRDVRYGAGGKYRFHIRFGQGNYTFNPHVRGSQNFPLSATTGIGIPSPETDQFLDDFMRKQMGGKTLAIAVQPGRPAHHAVSPDPVYQLVPVSHSRVGQLLSIPEIPRRETMYSDHSLNGRFVIPDELLTLNLIIGDPGRYRWTAISRRLGGQSDPAMRLKDADGKLLKESHMFDNESTLSHEFKDAGTYVMELWDVAGQFGSNAGFHIQTQTDPAEFELNTETDSARIEPGKDAKLKIAIARDGYNGSIKFAITTPVDGVSLSDVVAKKGSKERTIKIVLNESIAPGETFPIKISGYRGEYAETPRTPLYTRAYWKKRFPDLYSPMFEFEDTIWVTVLPSSEPEDKTENSDEAR